MLNEGASGIYTIDNRQCLLRINTFLPRLEKNRVRSGFMVANTFYSLNDSKDVQPVNGWLILVDIRLNITGNYPLLTSSDLDR